jgi:hypothetical protein
VPSMNQAPAAAPVGEMAFPGAVKNVRAITSKAGARAWRSQSVQPTEVDRRTACTRRLSYSHLAISVSLEGPDVPIDQPSDHEDDQDQSEQAANAYRSALTIIAAAVEPKPAAKEK